MNDRQLHDVLEQVSHSAPQVNAHGMARTATARADRSRRRGYAFAVPAAAAAAAVVVVATGAASHSGTGRAGQAAGPAGPAASRAVTATAAAPTGAAPSAVGPSPIAQSTGGGMAGLAYGSAGVWTCCDDADRAERVKVGGSFVAHFRSLGASMTGPAVTVTVVLTGPFADAKAMMADPPVPGGSRYTSVPLTLPGRADGVQAATVPVPDTAKPGLYLVSLAHGDTEGSAGSIYVTR